MIFRKYIIFKMVRELFPEDWEKKEEAELQKARADFAAIVEAVDKDKDKSLKAVSKREKW